MDDQKPDNMDEFEEEIAVGEFKDPTPHFDEEIEYLNEQSGQSKSVMSKIKKMPGFSMGWLGILLIVLIALFLFLPKGSKKIEEEELIILKSRVEDLESRQTQAELPEIYEQKIEKMETDILKTLQVGDRLNQLETLLVSKIDSLEQDIQNLKKQLEETQKMASAGTVKPTVKPNTGVPKKTPQADSTKYHIVKTGENVYRIGLKYNLTEAQLLELNNLKKGALIYPGQKLKVSR